MESKLKFIQDRTINLTFTGDTAVGVIDVPFAVDKIRFKFIATNSNTKAFVDLRSDMISWHTIAVFQPDDQIGTTASVDNVYHFQTPTKINGLYTFKALKPDGTAATALNTHSIVLVAQFIRDDM